MASLVTTAPSSGSGASSGLKWLISLAFPALATLSWAITMPGTWVTAASRCTFLFPPAFAPLRSLPSTATPWRAGTCPGSPQAAGSSQGWAGCGRNQPSSRSSRKLAAGRRLPLPLLLPFLPARAAVPRGARHTRPGPPGPARARPRPPSARPRTRPGPAASGSLSSIDADGATRSPVRGLLQQPCAASTSWSQPAAACATASGPCTPPPPPRPAPIPATPADAASPAPSAHRSAAPPATPGTTPDQAPFPAGRWRRRQSVSHDEEPGAVKAVLGDGSTV